MPTPANGRGFLRWTPAGGFLLSMPSARAAVAPYVVPACYLDMPTTLIDGTTSPYADLATATAAIAAQAMDGCMGEGRDLTARTLETRSTFVSAFSSNVFTLDSDATDTGSNATASVIETIVARLYLTAADGISINYSISVSGVGTLLTGPGSNMYVRLYEDDQSTIVSNVSGNGSTLSGTSSPAISIDGYYWVYSYLNRFWDTAGTATSSISLSCTGGTSLAPCTVRAAYGGTPDYLVCT